MKLLDTEKQEVLGRYDNAKFPSNLTIYVVRLEITSNNYTINEKLVYIMSTIVT
jgi:hypothetical protein